MRDNTDELIDEAFGDSGGDSSSDPNSGSSADSGSSPGGSSPAQGRSGYDSAESTNTSDGTGNNSQSTDPQAGGSISLEDLREVLAAGGSTGPGPGGSDPPPSDVGGPDGAAPDSGLLGGIGTGVIVAIVSVLVGGIALFATGGDD
jgi:hypothetical protein